MLNGSMKHSLLPWSCLAGALALACLTNSLVAAEHHSAGIGSSFSGPIGLQLYSLRDQFSKNVPATLDQVRGFGLDYVELAGTYNLTPEKFKEQLDGRGLKPVSGHFPFERYRDTVQMGSDRSPASVHAHPVAP